MSIVVQKYGGTSVADATRIMNVARRIVATYEQGHSVCAVVSARGDTTDELLELAYEISPDPPEREMDMLLTTGERISCALLAMAIHRLGKEAISFTGSQAGIVTDTVHGKARILDIRAAAVEEPWRPARSCWWPASRASRPRRKSPRSAAAARTRPPSPWRTRSAPRSARSTPTSTASTRRTRASSRRRASMAAISYDEMLEMAASGAQVLALRSVEYARKYGIPIHVRSSFTDADGTWVREEGVQMESEELEQPIIRAVTYSTDEAKVTVSARARPARRRGARVRRAGRRARQRRHDHPEHQRERPQRHHLHHPRRRPRGRRHGAARGRQGTGRARPTTPTTPSPR